MMRETILLVFFDLPVKTAESRRECRRFRTGLLDVGYSMLQKSIYFKLIPKSSMQQAERNKVMRLLPSEGNVQFLPIPLRQFQSMESLLGSPFDFKAFCSPIIEI